MGLLDSLATGIDMAGKVAEPLYEMWAQKKTWEREDNAVQRRVADLKAAGLSPTLAAGSAAETSAPVKVGFNQDFMGKIMQNNEMMRQKADIAYTGAQKNLVDMQWKSANIDRQSKQIDLDIKHGLADVLQEGARAEVMRKQSEASLAATTAADQARNLMIAVQRGVPSWDRGFLQQIANGGGLLSSFGPSVKQIQDNIGAQFWDNFMHPWKAVFGK